MSDQSSPPSPEITKMLRAWNSGERRAADDLLPLVYDELRRQAKRFLRRERVNHTLQPTALVNEAYLKIIGQHQAEWENRAHFFAIAANLMREILVDHARHKNRQKRGGAFADLPLNETLIATGENNQAIEILALNEALEKLAELDEQQSRIVEFRYFGGLNLAETAGALGLSEATVSRDWRMAKAWLHHELTR